MLPSYKDYKNNALFMTIIFFVWLLIIYSYTLKPGTSSKSANTNNIMFFGNTWVEHVTTVLGYFVDLSIYVVLGDRIFKTFLIH